MLGNLGYFLPLSGLSFLLWERSGARDPGKGVEDTPCHYAVAFPTTGLAARQNPGNKLGIDEALTVRETCTPQAFCGDPEIQESLCPWCPTT